MHKNTALNTINNLLKDPIIEGYLEKDNISHYLYSAGDKLLEINNQKIILANKIDLTSKLAVLHQSDIENFEYYDKFANFTQEIKSNIKRINHLGIRYFVTDLKTEVNHYKKELKDTPYHLYKEESVFENDKWLFVGNITNWEDPLFEIVLVEGNKDPWTPHFQIDIDTNLPYDKLAKILTRHFGKDFIVWTMDIKNVGIVLTLGQLVNISGYKIYLFVGTNLRDTKYMRTQLLDAI